MINFLLIILKVLIYIFSYFEGVIIILLLANFSYQHQLMIPNLCLSYSKSPQVSRTLLSIPANLKNSLVWIVDSSSDFQFHQCFSKPFKIILSAPTTIGMTITFMFLSFSSSLARIIIIIILRVRKIWERIYQVQNEYVK